MHPPTSTAISSDPFLTPNQNLPAHAATTPPNRMDNLHPIRREIDNIGANMASQTDADATQVQNTSGITQATLKAALVERLEATHVEIQDMSGGCGQMFEAQIVSPQFAKKATLARHRLVNTALKSEIAAIHAWTPKCFTPEEWEKKQSGA